MTDVDFEKLRRRIDEIHGPENQKAKKHDLEFSAIVENETVHIGEIKPEIAREFQKEGDRIFNTDEYTSLLNERKNLQREIHRRQGDRFKAAIESRLQYLSQRTREKESKSRSGVQRYYIREEERFVNTLRGEGITVQKFVDEKSQQGQWKSEWEGSPFSVTLKLKSIRGIREKLSRGWYVLLCNIYDRIGGSPVQYESALHDKCKAATAPREFEGKWWNLELVLDNKIQITVPSSVELKTHMVLVFELWKLQRGKYDPVDKVVGWSVFPLYSFNFKLITGSFKAPMLYGPLDLNVDSYERIQTILERDVKHWLGNLYFDVQVEKEGFADVSNPSHGPSENGSSSAMGADGENQEAENNEQEDRNEEEEDISDQELDGEKRVPRRKKLRKKVGNDRINEEKLSHHTQDHSESSAVSAKREDYNYDQLYAIAASSMRHSHSISKKREFLESPKRFSDMLYLIVWIAMYEIGLKVKKRTIYIKALHWNQILYYPGIVSVGRFILSVLLAIVCIWLRMFIHNLGTWFWISSHNVPFLKEIWSPVWVEIEWRVDHYLPSFEVMAIAAGPMTLMAFFVLFALINWISKKLFLHFPIVLTRIVLWFGIASVLDPFILLSTDSIRMNFRKGEAFLLYHYFFKYEGSGVLGVVLTCVVYTQISLVSLIVFYWFCVYAFVNGRVVDTYLRTLSPEASFFVPTDLEISKTQLDTIVDRCKQWRSDSGAYRRVNITYRSENRSSLFRERLFALLSESKHTRSSSSASSYSMYLSDTAWINSFLNNITLKLRRGGRHQQNMGTFQLGSDIRDFLRRRHPYLLGDDQYNSFKREDNSYWDEYIFNIIDVTSLVEEEKKEFCNLVYTWLQYRCTRHTMDVEKEAPAGVVKRPCAWVTKDELLGDEDVDDEMENCTPIRILDVQLLADFLFFETGSPSTRLSALQRALYAAGCDLSWWQTAVKGKNGGKVSVVVRIPNFNMDDKYHSIEGDQMSAALLSIDECDPATKTSKLYRQFIICPNGSIVEPVKSKLTDLEQFVDESDPGEKSLKKNRMKQKIHLTPEDNEYWILMFHHYERRRSAQHGSGGGSAHRLSTGTGGSGASSIHRITNGTPHRDSTASRSDR